MIDKEQVFLGSLMGDGYIPAKQKVTHNAKYEERHCIAQEGYLLWKSHNLPFETTGIKTYGKNVALTSRHNPYLNEYYGYRKDNTKLKEIINKLDVLGILIWIFDDGYFNYVSKCYEISAIRLHFDVHLYIKEIFKNKFGLEPKLFFVKKDKGYIIKFNVDDSKKLLRWFNYYLNYLPDCMLYKLGMDKKRLEQQTHKAKITSKTYREDNKEKIKRRNKLYVNNNRDKYNAYHRRYRTENIDKVRKQGRECWNRNHQLSNCELCSALCENKVCGKCCLALRKIGLYAFGLGYKNILSLISKIDGNQDKIYDKTTEA